MEINLAAATVLSALDRCNGHLTHHVVRGTVSLYDPSVQGLGERVEVATLAYILDNGLLTRIGGPDALQGPGERRYKINEAGRAAIRTLASQHR